MIDRFLEIINKYMSRSLKKSYLEVVKKFPSIQEEDISIIYKPGEYVAIRFKDLFELVYGGRSTKKAVIYFDPYFSKVYCREDEAKAIIAHELGHYEHKTRGSLKAFRRRMLWDLVYDTFHEVHSGNNKIMLENLRISNSSLDKYVFKQLQDEKRLARLEKCQQLEELYSDNKTVEAGYGKAMLSVSKKMFNRDKDLGPDPFFEARIKNLEEKLEKGIEDETS